MGMAFRNKRGFMPLKYNILDLRDREGGVYLFGHYVGIGPKPRSNAMVITKDLLSYSCSSLHTMCLKIRVGCGYSSITPNH